MPSEDWTEQIRDLASTSPDIVSLLTAMAERNQQFREHIMFAAMAAREALDLSMIQVNALIGWLKGEVSDEILREEIPGREPGTHSRR